MSAVPEPSQGWRNHTEIGQDGTVHVWPDEDVLPHLTGEGDGYDCSCDPVVEDVFGVLLVKHNAFDGREPPAEDRPFCRRTAAALPGLPGGRMTDAPTLDRWVRHYDSTDHASAIRDLLDRERLLERIAEQTAEPPSPQEQYDHRKIAGSPTPWNRAAALS